MKKIAVIIAALLFTNAAYALNPYIAIKGGYEDGYQKNNYPTPYWDSYNKTYEADNTVLGLAIGNQFSDIFRAELAYNYKFDNHTPSRERTFRPDPSVSYGIYTPSREVKQHTLLLNSYLHPLKDSFISPYIGIGAGWGWSKFANTEGFFKGNYTRERNFSYAIYLGTDYDITENLAIDLSFTYNRIFADSKETYKIL